MTLSLEHWATGTPNHGLGLVTDLTLVGTEADASDCYMVAVWAFRNNDGAALTGAPTRHGDALTLLAEGGLVGQPDEMPHELLMYGLVPDVGTFDIAATLNTFKYTTSGWLNFAGVDPTTPLGTILTQSKTPTSLIWSAPSLSPVSDTGDIIVSVLMLDGYNKNLDDVSAAVVHWSGAQTLLFDLCANDSTPASNFARIIVTTAPAGSTVSYSFTGTGTPQPIYQHFAFAVKAGAGAVTPPTAAFSASVSGKTVTVVDESTAGTNPITAYDWDWGDETTHGTVQNPAPHVYATGGKFTVTLTVTAILLEDQAHQDVITTTTYRYTVGTNGTGDFASVLATVPDAD